MSNHFHILLEVPPMPEGGFSDAELLRRIGCANSPNYVATVAQELARARGEKDEAWAAEIHARFTYRMHDLSKFMKTLSPLRRTERSWSVNGSRCRMKRSGSWWKTSYHE